MTSWSAQPAALVGRAVTSSEWWRREWRAASSASVAIANSPLRAGRSADAKFSFSSFRQPTGGRRRRRCSASPRFGLDVRGLLAAAAAESAKPILPQLAIVRTISIPFMLILLWALYTAAPYGRRGLAALARQFRAPRIFEVRRAQLTWFGGLWIRPANVVSLVCLVMLLATGQLRWLWGILPLWVLPICAVFFFLRFVASPVWMRVGRLRQPRRSGTANVNPSAVHT